MTALMASRDYPCVHGTQRVVDIRPEPDGQLAGFAKSCDLAWFLHHLNNCDYVHLPELAPSFEALIHERGILATLCRASFEIRKICLLCSEPTPERYHCRRLVAERIVRFWPGVEIVRLV